MRIAQRAVTAAVETERKRVRANDAGCLQRVEQARSARAHVAVRPGAVDDARDAQRALPTAGALAHPHGEAVALRRHREDPAGHQRKLPAGAEVVDGRRHLRGEAVAVDVPVAGQAGQEAALLLSRATRPRAPR